MQKRSGLRCQTVMVMKDRFCKYNLKAFKGPVKGEDSELFGSNESCRKPVHNVWHAVLRDLVHVPVVV